MNWLSDRREYLYIFTIFRAPTWVIIILRRYHNDRWCTTNQRWRTKREVSIVITVVLFCMLITYLFRWRSTVLYPSEDLATCWSKFRSNAWARAGTCPRLDAWTAVRTRRVKKSVNSMCSRSIVYLSASVWRLVSCYSCSKKDGPLSYQSTRHDGRKYQGKRHAEFGVGTLMQIVSHDFVLFTVFLNWSTDCLHYSTMQ